MVDVPLADGGARLKGLHILKPIVYGNNSKYFGKKREDNGHTHQWTVYVKPYRNEDMSAYVKKVNFKLHDSYSNHNRTVTKPPYEVTETGWGEFEIVIKIYFQDPVERPVTIHHILKLFQTGQDTDHDSLMKSQTNVVSEFYDEIIFQDPTQNIQPLLSTTRPLSLGAYKHETDFEEKNKTTLMAIKSGRTQIQTEIADMKSKLELAKTTTTTFMEEIKKAQKEKSLEQSIV
eukprot:GFUD01045137.1.p1 GENE.GFUD01045137.1~~GFUD01045137.1.p1  ORF type:complete len:232 (+),score=64.13 GFUD01045137.1:75-770(+)